MITLKTLDSASEQEVFDQVAKHLLTQNKSSRAADGYCAYRGEDNLRCAAGCLISDDEYDPKMEGASWDVFVDQHKITQRHKHLIRALQIMHDSHVAYVWPRMLQHIAKSYDLNYTVITEMQAKENE